MERAMTLLLATQAALLIASDACDDIPSLMWNTYYRKKDLYRVSSVLLSVFLALGKERLCRVSFSALGKDVFAECLF
jgi:hypothetical protein